METITVKIDREAAPYSHPTMKVNVFFNPKMMEDYLSDIGAEKWNNNKEWLLFIDMAETVEEVFDYKKFTHERPEYERVFGYSMWAGAGNTIENAMKLATKCVETFNSMPSLFVKPENITSPIIKFHLTEINNVPS